MNCDVCNANLKVTITGGDFIVDPNSDLDNPQFTKPATIELSGPAEPVDEEEMLTVKVECTVDPSHMVFGTTEAAVKSSIYMRLHMATQRLARKWFTGGHS